MKLHLTVSPISQNQNSQSVSTEVAKKNLPGCIIVRKETIASSLPVDSIRQIPVMSNSRTSVVQKNHLPVKISENKCIDQHVKQLHAKQSPVEKSHVKQPNVKQSNVEAVVSSADKTTKVNGGRSFRVFEPTNARCRTVSSKRLSHNDEKKLAKLIQRSFDLNKPTRPHKHKYVWAFEFVILKMWVRFVNFFCCAAVYGSKIFIPWLLALFLPPTSF